MFKIDTEQKGIEAVFKPYQYAVVKHIVDHNTWSMTTAEIHTALTRQGIKISKASVINYLAKLSAHGIITRTEESAKGGYRGVYSAKLTLPEIIHRIKDDLLNSLLGAFPEKRHLKYVTEE